MEMLSQQTLSAIRRTSGVQMWKHGTIETKLMLMQKEAQLHASQLSEMARVNSQVMIQQTDGSMDWKQIIIWDTRSITDQSVEDSILSLSMLCQEEGRMRRGVLSILSFEPHKRAVLADGG